MLLSDPAKVVSHENDPEIVILYDHNQVGLHCEMTLHVEFENFLLTTKICFFYFTVVLQFLHLFDIIYSVLFAFVFFFCLFCCSHILIQTFVLNGTITCFILDQVLSDCNTIIFVLYSAGQEHVKSFTWRCRNELSRWHPAFKKKKLIWRFGLANKSPHVTMSHRTHSCAEA